MTSARVTQGLVETLTAIPPSPAVVTQLVAEVVNVVPASPLAATQVAAEIVFANPNDARVTHLVCELIIVRVARARTPCPSQFPLS